MSVSERVITLFPTFNWFSFNRSFLATKSRAWLKDKYNCSFLDKYEDGYLEEVSEAYKFDIKFFDELGNLIVGSSSSSTPSASDESQETPCEYSYSCEAWVGGVDGRDFCGSIRYYGCDHWPAGNYRVEVWYDGKMLKAKEFTIY